MELKNLVGKHVLTGVDRTVLHDRGCFGAEDANAIIFELDGVTYIAEEDPDDGYRSYCKDLEVYDGRPKNLFPAVEVECRCIKSMANRWETYECDILEFIDCKTHAIVLMIGTTNTDDYYPCCIFEWYPQNMAINRKEND